MSFGPIQMQVLKERTSRIDLIVSKGPNSFEMPNYVGETRAKAEEDLKNTYKVSSKMITIEEVETFDYAAGTVLEQTPAPGEQYSLNSKNQDCFESSERNDFN